VTASAAHLHVLSLQGECCFLVVEVCHPVQPIVAIQTIRAEILVMFDDKCLIFFPMALGTGGLRYREICVLLVTVIAFHRGCIVIDLMAQQAKVRCTVVEVGTSRSPGVKISALMLGMACVTLLDVGYPAVRALSALDLSSRAVMAIQT